MILVVLRTVLNNQMLSQNGFTAYRRPKPWNNYLTTTNKKIASVIYFKRLIKTTFVKLNLTKLVQNVTSFF